MQLGMNMVDDIIVIFHKYSCFIDVNCFPHFSLTLAVGGVSDWNIPPPRSNWDIKCDLEVFVLIKYIR
jgi:hypothetical protein